MSGPAVAAPTVRGFGLVSGWGRGLGALPAQARAAAGARGVIAADPPRPAGEQFRRTPREGLLALTAVQEALADAAIPGAALAGNRTALVYTTAAAYAASNRAFIEATGTAALEFPYTAPSAVPAGVAIELGITGPYVIFLGGGTATLLALWHAATLLAGRQCDRALVLAVETFAECADLWARGRWCANPPQVEAAACVLLEPGAGALTYAVSFAGRAGDPAGGVGIRRRLGETLACAPLAELGAARAAERPLELSLTAAWHGAGATLHWSEASP